MPTSPRAADHAATSHPLISDHQLRRMYVTLLRTRLLARRNRAKGMAALVAREAIVTGTVAHLQEGDVVMPVPGDRLAALALGHALRQVLTTTSVPGVLSSASTPAARFAIATGYALAHQDKSRIVLAFSGPGITSLDTLQPALAYAAQHKLGIVFVIETAANADVSSARHTEPLGLYGIPVDGNDVIAIYRVAQEAIHRARRGVGPTLIDCKPWPLGNASDPVRRLEEALERRGLPTSRLKESTIGRFRAELSRMQRKRG